MIDPRDPDYTDTPACERRPIYDYRPESIASQIPLSIVTPCYNVGSWFNQTVKCIQQQSFQQFEWILVDDGSTDGAGIDMLHRLAERDSRVRVVSQKNSGPSAARNRGALEAKAEFLFWIDSDDLIEPTYLEKALWFLESHPQFAFCNSWVVGFGNQEYLWPRGFEQGRACLRENQADNKTVVRRHVHTQIGGFDESIRVGHEDWDYWLSMASHGFWGWTIPEFQIWYRRREDSRINQTDGDARRKSAFMDFLRQKYAALYDDESRFPRPPDTDDLAPARVTFDISWANPLANPENRNRLLLIVPWLTMGGADKFNLDLIEQLKKRDWEVTIATTMPADHVCLPEFARHTPDIFCLDKFLRLADYPRFLLYLLRSRGITHVLVSNSQLGYELLPMLRSHYQRAAFMDYCHSETPGWKDGGYPAMSARWTECLDVHGVSSNQLRNRLIDRGVKPEKAKACYINIDSDQWDPAGYDRKKLRASLLDDSDSGQRPIMVFTGRFVEDKRPKFLMEILRRLRDEGGDFLALLAGEGNFGPYIESFIEKHHLGRHVRLLGALPYNKIPELLAAADIFLLPSQVEGISLALYEALAMGVVPVSADIGGQAELVTPQVGYLIPHDEPEVEIRAYLSVLQRLIDDVDYRQKLSQAARRRIVEHFHLDNMGQCMHEMLLLAGRNHLEKPLPTMPQATAAECAVMSIDRFRLERLADHLWIQLHRQTTESVVGQPEGPPTVSMARAELNYIENSKSWRRIQGLKRTFIYRGLNRILHGKNWDRIEFSDPRDKLAAIKRSRSYRLLQAIKRTALYRLYARRKYGPDFASPFN